MKRSRGVAAQLQRGRRLPDEEEQDRGGRRRGEARAGRAAPKVVVARATAARARSPPSTSSSPPAPAPAPSRPPASSPTASRIWTYRDALTPEGSAEDAAGDRLRRHRHGVRELLQHPRRRGDGRRDAAAHPARGRRGGHQGRAKALQEAGHSSSASRAKDKKLTKTEGRGALEIDAGRQDRDPGRRRRHRRPWASPPTSRTSAWKPRASRSRAGHIVTDSHGGTSVPGLYAIGDVSRAALARAQGQPRGRPLRRAHRRPEAARNLDDADPRLHLHQPQVASVGLTEEAGQGSRPRAARSAASRSACNGKAIAARRDRGLRQDGVRRQDRRAAGRAT